MADIATRTHHALDYIEIGVTDFHAAKAFYGSAFGWTFTDYGPGPAYVGIRGVDAAHDTEVGGFRLDDQVTPAGRSCCCTHPTWTRACRRSARRVGR